RKVVKNKHGDIISDYVEKEPVPGGIVKLTIDKNFQQFVQTALERNMEYIKANRKGGENSKGAAIVVMDTKNFEVLASATYPNYNIDDYSTNYSSLLSAENNPLFNRATMGLYRPGSIFKPSVAATALKNGVVSEGETVNCSGVYTVYPDYHPECQNRAAHGATNVNKALSVSCNIFFYEMGRRLGINALNEGVSLFGFGQTTGIQVPENSGVLSSPDVKKAGGIDWYPGDTLQAAIGQSDTNATPLQLGVYTATLANGGTRLKTSVVGEVKSYDYTQTFFENEKNVLSQFENKNNALEIVKKGMVACSRSGSARSVFGNYPIEVASKTGSPQTATNKSDGTFITYGPASDPEIAIAIVGENITHGYYLATLAREVYDYYFYTKSVNAEIKPDGQLIQ
ncbi:MAG: penicillin-binding transpeptidase domain-containing protein, partial [Oscillospiraceae bacterium]